MPRAHRDAIRHLLGAARDTLDASEADGSQDEDGPHSWLRDLKEMAALDVVASPPMELRARLREMFDARQQRSAGADAIRLLAGELTFDSRQSSVAAVRKSGAVRETQQLIYSTDAADVALSIVLAPNEPRRTLFGQVLPWGDAAADDYSVQLLSDCQELALVTTDETGEFVLRDVPPGDYRLVVSSGQHEVALDPVEIG